MYDCVNMPKYLVLDSGNKRERTSKAYSPSEDRKSGREGEADFCSATEVGQRDFYS